MTDYRPIDTIPAASLAEVHERLERLLTVLERVRDGAASGDTDDAPAQLASASALLEVFEVLRADIEPRTPARAWDGSSAVASRVALDLYTGAVRDLRAVAMESRRRLQQADVVFADARELSRVQLRQAERLAKKRRA